MTSTSQTQNQQQQQQQSSSPSGGATATQHQQSGNAAGLLLDGDGILTQLFYFFWRMKVNAVASAGGGNVTTGTYNPAKPPKSDDPAIQAVMDLCIPSTVILEHNFPKFWYAKSGDFDDDDITLNRSSSLSSAPLERRTGRDIDSAAVTRAFRVPEGSSAAQTPASGDIVASYYAEATDEEGRACTRVEFLDVEGVKGLLIRRTRRPDGILQCWVSPSGKSNSVVQVIWSPHVTHVTKRKNRFPLRDTRLPLYDRAVTFEGLAHFSDESFVAPHVKIQTKLVCDELVRHFREVHRVTVTRMVLYFKTDTAGRLWFLFGNSLRTADRRQISLSLRGMKPQERIDNEHAQSSRMARMLIDEAYEVKAAHQAHSKMEEYASAHKKIRQAAKEEPLIRSLIGSQAPPYANLRPKPPTLGPIGETYWQNPRKIQHKVNSKSSSGQNNEDGEDHQNEKENHDQDADPNNTFTLDDENNNNNSSNIINNSNLLSPGSVASNSPQRKSQAAVSLSRLVSKIKTASMLSPSSSGVNNNNNEKKTSSMLTSSLACVIPPLFGPTGTLGGSSFAMFSSGGAGASSSTSHHHGEPSLASELEKQELRNETSGSQQQQPSPLKRTISSFVEEAKTQSGAAFGKGRRGYVLWQIVRLAVFSGAVKIVGIRPELKEFLKGLMYGIYSHFSCENTTSKMVTGRSKGQTKPFRIVVPRTYFRALSGDTDIKKNENGIQTTTNNSEEWWSDLGFSRVRVVTVSEVHVLLPPPPSKRRQHHGNSRRIVEIKEPLSPIVDNEKQNQQQQGDDGRSIAQQSHNSSSPAAPASLNNTQQNLGAEVREALSEKNQEEDKRDEEQDDDNNDDDQNDGNNNNDEGENEEDADDQLESEQRRQEAEAAAALDNDDDGEYDETDRAFKPILYSGYKKKVSTAAAVAATPVATPTKEKNGEKIAVASPEAVDASNSTPKDTDDSVVPAFLPSPSPQHVARSRSENKNNNQWPKGPQRPAEVPINAHPDDLVLEVASLATPLLHVQSQMEKLIKRRIDLPAARLKFYYAAHRVIMERKRARRFASVVKQTWNQAKGKDFQ